MMSIARRLGAMPLIMAGAMGCQVTAPQGHMPTDFAGEELPAVVRCAYPEENESSSLDARSLLNLIAGQTPALESVRALEGEAAIRRQKAATPGWFKHMSSEERLWLAGAMAQDAQAVVKAADAIYKAQAEASELLVDLRASREAMRHIDDSEVRLKKVLARAENARKASEAAAPLVEAIKADLAGRETARAKLMAQDSAARARLRYLAGIDPAGELNLELPPLDQPKWINGDLSPAACADQATAQGPGVVAADTLVATLRDCVGMLEGKSLVGSKALAEKKVDFQGALNQAIAARRELDAKLRLGAVEAAEAISAGTRQAAAAAKLLSLAQAATRMIDERVEMNAPGFGAKELFETEGALELARTEELKARLARHKAHARLWLLVGQP
jgi:hypothetical protein